MPVGKKSAYEAFDGWMMFEEIVEGELEEKVVDGLNYSYVKGGSTAKVIAGDYSAMESVTIPGSIIIDGVKYYVKEIAGWAFYNLDNLKTVKIESGVESIGSRAFYHCEGLTDLAFPSTLKMIRDYAFMYCRQITSLVLPEGLTSIGECAFMECYNLQKLELPSSLKNIGGSAFIYCGSLTSVISRIQTPFEIEESVFASGGRWNDEEQKSVFTPSSATLYVPVGKKSAYEAFDGWMMFEEIFEGEPKEGLGVDGFNYSYIPESKVATLIKGDYSALQNVSIPATAVIGGTTYNVVGVGTSAFESTSVKSVTVSNGVKTIGKNAFYDCYQMTSVSMPESITKIGESAFSDCSRLDTIAISGKVESIGNYAFSGCKIKEVIIPSSTKTIGYGAFRNCRQIISIRVDAANTVYDSRNNCNALIETASNTLMLGCPSTIIPNSINEIYNYAFYGFSNLTQISIPNSVTTIRNGAFESCSGLTSIYIPSSVTTIENNIFYGCNSLNSIKVDPNNTVYDSRNDCNALIKTSTNTLVSGCNKTIIPRGIKTIGSNSFSGISGLDSLKIPYGVEKIQNYAFSYNSVRYVEIPNSIKTIGWYAFGGNDELTTIVCKIKNPSDVNVDEGAFYDSSIQSSAVLYVPKGMKSVYEQATNIWRNFSNITEMDGEPLAAPTLSYDGRAVTATSTEKDVDLYYSTDGTVPSNYYEGPIAVSNLGTVKVIAEKSFCADSEPSTYDVKYLYDGDTLKLAEAGLMAEAIKWCGNDYVVKMTVVGPINSAEFETIRTLKNLKFLNLAEAKVDGLTIPDNAFANSNIVSFVAPATIRSVGSGIFTGCQQLAAINWNTNVSLPGDALADVSNPNLLLYLKEGASVPAGVKNVIIGGAATKITLVDATGNNNFYCPVAFTTDSITYTRNFQQKTEVGVSRGWETIVLPFDVKTIVHEKNGNLVSFANYRSWNNEKPFWLYTLEENNISAASEIKANVPYLICMPNDDVYGDDYILAGNVTFSAFDKSKKIRIDVSKPVEKSQYDIAFVPAYQRVPASADVFALNVNQEYMGYPAGSLFVNNFREVRPFEAYSLHPNTSKVAAARMIMVSSLIGDGDDTTGVIDVMMKKKDAKNGGDAIIKVYTLSGALIKQGRADEVTKSLPKGIYIANGKKFVIK